MNSTDMNVKVLTTRQSMQEGGVARIKNIWNLPFSQHSQLNPIELYFNPTKSNTIYGLSLAVKPNRTRIKIMHLSMSSQRGWRQGIGRDFDRSLWPEGRAFEFLNYLAVPGVRIFEFMSVPVTTNHFPGGRFQLYLTSHFCPGIGNFTAFFLKNVTILPYTIAKLQVTIATLQVIMALKCTYYVFYISKDILLETLTTYLPTKGKYGFSNASKGL